MKVAELIRAMDRQTVDRLTRDRDRDRIVVVELNSGGGLVEVDGVRYGHGGLMILTLWRPPTVRRTP